MTRLPAPYKIMIADDHIMFSDAICELLRPHYSCVSQVFDGAALLHAVKKQMPDLLLLDINLPRVNGIEAAKTIRSTNPKLKIIVVTMYNHSGMVRTAREMQLDGYILKDSPSQTLLAGIESVFIGNTFFDPLLNKKPEPRDEFSKFWILTNREKQVINGLVSGKKADVIAAELGLAYETIKTHRKNIYFKLEINSLAELINIVRSSGFN